MLESLLRRSDCYSISRVKLVNDILYLVEVGAVVECSLDPCPLACNYRFRREM